VTKKGGLPAQSQLIYPTLFFIGLAKNSSDNIWRVSLDNSLCNRMGLPVVFPPLSRLPKERRERLEREIDEHLSSSSSWE
jgi:hypothetical protein